MGQQYQAHMQPENKIAMMAAYMHYIAVRLGSCPLDPLIGTGTGGDPRFAAAVQEADQMIIVAAARNLVGRRHLDRCRPNVRAPGQHHAGNYHGTSHDDRTGHDHTGHDRTGNQRGREFAANAAEDVITSPARSGRSDKPSGCVTDSAGLLFFRGCDVRRDPAMQ